MKEYSSIKNRFQRVITYKLNEYQTNWRIIVGRSDEISGIPPISYEVKTGINLTPERQAWMKKSIQRQNKHMDFFTKTNSIYLNRKRADTDDEISHDEFIKSGEAKKFVDDHQEIFDKFDEQNRKDLSALIKLELKAEFSEKGIPNVVLFPFVFVSLILYYNCYIAPGHREENEIRRLLEESRL